MVGEVVLRPKRKTIQPSITRVPLILVDIVNRENQLLPQEFVVGHQNGAIEPLKLVVPQNMKDFGLCFQRVEKEPGVVCKHSRELLKGADIRIDAATQIEQVNARVLLEWRAV